MQNKFSSITSAIIYILILVSINLTAQEKVDEVIFIVKEHFCDNPFSLVLSCNTIDAKIRYTLDGTVPSISDGILYSTPLYIDNTSIIRAIAFNDILLPSGIKTHTYIFLDSVLIQSSNPMGFPSKWINSSGNSIPADYEMDPEYPEDNSIILDALKALPVVSIVMDPDDLFGTESFHNNGDRNDNGQWEKPCSVEFIFGDSTVNYQVNAGVQPRGHGIESCLKRGFRIDFKSMYGPGKMDFPLFSFASDTSVKAAKRYDSVIMRPGFMENYTGKWYNPFLNIYFRDPMMRDLQLNVSGYGTHNLMAHMYLNGLYWGIYNLTENVEPDMLIDYLGGNEEQWFVTKANSKDYPTGGFVEGNPERFLEFMDYIDQEDFTKSDTYREVQKYIDVEAFAEYIFMYSFWGVGDWPDNNWIFAIHGGINPIPGKFYAWDAEKPLLENDDPQSYKHAWYSPYLTDESLWDGRAYVSPPSRVWRSLIENADFRMLYADKAYQLMSHDARMTNENMIAWIDKYIETVDVALRADQKRWSDTDRRDNSPGRIFTYADVQAEIDKVKRNIEDNVNEFKAAFRAPGLYPTLEPPAFSNYGGKITEGFAVELSNPNNNGSVYFTIDGSDPRKSGGAVAEGAIESNNAVVLELNETSTFKARVFNNGEWSPLEQATYITPSNSDGLLITEIMYHPEDYGNTDGDMLEFIELKNSGDQIINLSQYSFTSGISYTFPDGFLLAPGNFVVLAKEASKFTHKYKLKPDGVYIRNLGNEGDSVVLHDPFNKTIITVNYDDKHPWPQGDGISKYSITLINPEAGTQMNNPANWRLSKRLGGSPGMDDLEYLNYDYRPLKITEIMYSYPDILDPNGEELEFIEIKNTGQDSINLVGVHFSDGIDYTFYGDRIVKPDEILVLVTDGPDFYNEYGLFAENEYSKRLSNQGERISLSEPNGNTIFSVKYGINMSWPEVAAGNGFSLVPKSSNSNLDPDNPEYWRSSYYYGGSPGSDDSIDAMPNEVLFIVGSESLRDGDIMVHNRLKSLGLSITIKDPNKWQTADNFGKNLIIISSTVSSIQVQDKFKMVKIPIMNWDFKVTPNLGMTGDVEGVDFGLINSQNLIQILSPGHFLASDLTAAIEVTSDETTMPWGNPNNNAIRVASLIGNTKKLPIFAYEKGAIMPGLTAPERRLNFMLHNTSSPLLTENGWKLFDASVHWCIGREATLSLPEVKTNENAIGLSNYPNPFSGYTTISYQLYETSKVNIQVLNINGQLIETLVDGIKSAAIHHIAWEANALNPGIYIIKLQTPTICKVHKCIII